MFIAAAVLISYSIALVVAGHGAVPMAALLVTGRTDSWWAPGKIVGWIGIACLIMATLLPLSPSSRRLTFQFFSSVVLYLSWLATAILGDGESGSLWSSFALSTPFQITVFIMAYRVIFSAP